MKHGISCGGARYDFFFFSDGQLKDKQCWMYSTQLSDAFSSIKGARNFMGNFEKIKNPGKKMSRYGTLTCFEMLGFLVKMLKMLVKMLRILVEMLRNFVKMFT